jgi:hypothetical protein
VLQLAAVAYLAVRLGPDLGPIELAVVMFVAGVGLGFSSMPYLLGVQNAVAWHRRGIATSSVPFFRSIGGAVAVALLGTILAASLKGTGADPDALLDARLRNALAPGALVRLQVALSDGLETVFLALVALAALGLAVAFLVPAGSARGLIHPERDEVTARREAG